MQYSNIVQGRFLRRVNRFLAFVEIDGKEEAVHVKNTGRCKELLIEGAIVFLEKAENKERKTKFSLIGVYKGQMLVNMDSQAPNQVVAEALAQGRIKELGEVDFLRREVTFGNSRFDLYYEKAGQKGFIEVKGVTLEENGIAMFPDAPTERGTKHVRELFTAVAAGYKATMLFVVQMEGIKAFCPHWRQDEKFCHALCEAERSGVEVLAYGCRVEQGSLVLDKFIPITLEKKH